MYPSSTSHQFVSGDGRYARFVGLGLASMPGMIANLEGIVHLDLSDNDIAFIPEWVGRLTALTTLDLSSNRVAVLPEAIGNLTALTTLDLSSNRVAVLPEAIGNLTALTKLNLNNNQLTKVPVQLADRLINGLKLDIGDNPLADPLPEIVGRGADALATYLLSLEDAIEQYEAKLLLVGEGNVGKTSLVAALRGAPFVVDRPTTHGIEISPLKFDHPSLNVEMILRAWDFGGQPVYRVSHQFFFS